MDLKKIAMFAFGPIGSAAIGFVTLPLLSWYVPQEIVGQYSLFHALLAFLVMALCFGLDMVLMREYHETDIKSKLQTMFLLCALIFTSVIIAFLFVFGVDDILSSQLGQQNNNVVYLLFSSVIISLVIRFLAIVFRMEERGIIFSLSQILPKLILLILILAFVCAGMSLDFFDITFFYLVAIFFTAGYLFFKSKGVFSFVDLPFVKMYDFLAMSLPIMFGSMALWGLMYIDKLFVSNLLGFEEVAVYSLSASFASVGMILQMVFTTIWAPIVYKKVAEVKGVEDIFSPAIKKLSFIAFLYLCFVGVIYPIIPKILPNSYSEMSSILMTLMLVPVVNIFSEAVAIGINLSRKTHYIMIGSFLALLVNVLLNMTLIPLWGITGAAIATLLSYVVFAYLRVAISFKVWTSFSIKYFSMTLAIVIVVSFLYSFAPHEYRQDFWFFWFLCLLIFFVVTLKVGVNRVKLILMS